MAPTCSVLTKSFMVVSIISFMFVSASSYYGGAPNAQPPSYAADLPTLCNFDELYIVGTKYLDNINNCNVGVLRTCGIKQIYQLGDSLSDVGNLIREIPATPFARFPYGSDFPTGPTGRASNGKLIIDYLAMDADLPLLPPFKKSDADFSHGVSFAVGGATALPSNVLEAMNISTPMSTSSMSMQLDWMSSYMNSICHKQKDCGGKFENALFILGPFGGSDYHNALFQGKSLDEIETTILTKVVDEIMSGVRRLISLGAKKIMVPGIHMAYGLPIYQTAFTKEMLHKGEFIAMDHSDALEYAIKKLNEEQGHDADVIFGDYYRAFLTMKSYALLEEAMDYNDMKACCGSGGRNYKMDLGRMCGDKGVSACKHPQRKINWDGMHLTQEAYRIMTKDVLYSISVDLHCPSS